MKPDTVVIRRATKQDEDGIWAILEPVIRAGETYALPRDMSRQEALGYWLQAAHETHVAADETGTVGTYYLRPNQMGGGGHVANCGYMTAGWAVGRGIARAMCLHSLERARAGGFLAMQFNLVVGTNARAIHLWQSLGFEVVGQLPLAFAHPRLGLVDALVMYRAIGQKDGG